MSRGPGVAMRNIMRVFEEHPDKHFCSLELTALALGGEPDFTDSEYASYRRAMRTLAAQGKLADLGRNWRYGRRRYALPAKEAWLREDHKQKFGTYPEWRRVAAPPRG